jgi:hypothetical protein
MQYPVGVRIISTPCTGMLEIEHIHLEAFEKGIDSVLVIGCLEGGCYFVEDNLRARKRTDRIRLLLEEIGVGSERLLITSRTQWLRPLCSIYRKPSIQGAGSQSVQDARTEKKCKRIRCLTKIYCGTEKHYLPVAALAWRYVWRAENARSGRGDCMLSRFGDAHQHDINGFSRICTDAQIRENL